MNAEVNPRRCDPELIEEDLRHVGVEMLTGVDQKFGVTSSAQGATNRRGFDELRPSADYG